MYASGSSPPPHDIDASASAPTSAPDTPAPIPTSSNNGTSIAQQPSRPTAAPANRKRKRGQAPSTAHAASPAPSEPGSTAENGATDLLASRTDLYARPILSISRGPTFVPVSEDSEWCKTDSAAVNRLGYRYVPAGINPPGFITPCRTIESNPTSFRISWEDRSQSLRVTRDGLGLGGFKGFRSARCNAPMREGKWYLEVKIEVGGGDIAPDALESSKGHESHVRLGWGRREAPLNGPVGLDGYSYGIRDKTGEKVTVSRPKPYGKAFKSGDVIGMYISLPPLRQPNKKDPHDPAHIHRERIPIDLKGQEVFEILEYPTCKEMTTLMEAPTKATNTASLPSSSTKKPATGAKLPDRSNAPAEKNPKTNTPPLRPIPILEGSRIAFFVNGECQGTAFQDIYDFLPLKQTDNQRKAKGRRSKEGVKEHRENPFDDGTLGYYPMVSVYNDAAVKLNPGPNFDFPPPPDIDALLDGRPQPAEPVKTEPLAEASLNEVKMDVDGEAKPTVKNNATWRPAVERYPEFMKEQWALDALEEEEAKAELQKQKAKEDRAGAYGAKGRKGETRKAATTKAAAARKKKATATEESSKAGTPVPDEAGAVGGVSKKPAAPRKKAKKAEGQAALGVAGPQHATEVSTPRSATETPAGTPPPSISSTAAAAAAAHLHLHHHTVVGRQDISNRPSPSPLRHSTAYMEQDIDDEIADAASRDWDALPAHPQHSSSSQAPRSRAPPGSKEGRQRAAAAVAAAAQASGPHVPPSTWSSPPVSGPPSSIGAPQARVVGNSAMNLMSLAALATGSPPTIPSNPPRILVGPGMGMHAPTPVSVQVPYRHIGGGTARIGANPARDWQLDEVERGRPGGGPWQMDEIERSRPGSVYTDREGEDDDIEDEFLAAAGASSGSERDTRRLEEEEEEEDDEDEQERGRRPPVNYGRAPHAEVEEEEEDDRASAPEYGDRYEEGATTDGGDSFYEVERGRDVEMESDDGGGVLGDEDGYPRGETRSRSPP
ncbi:hypothetical protein DFP72DRAFT_322907 [Ephemerocybe angulata]|uniref:B30.2/SPRY domain-containing protein n=1 Tax=Ephemerocybe angulata TaxID=980116 RepID=A0A8H6MFX8_9AGAR|nr:hypothetical protein DFP72DRAFT_322907 [Tulosesus angulatus]